MIRSLNCGFIYPRLPRQEKISAVHQERLELRCCRLPSKESARSAEPRDTSAEEDQATKEMVRYVNASRHVYLSTTIIKGRLIARIAILNLRTTAEIMDAIRAFVSVSGEKK
jgi:hypothetical protein